MHAQSSGERISYKIRSQVRVRVRVIIIIKPFQEFQEKERRIMEEYELEYQIYCFFIFLSLIFRKISLKIDKNAKKQQKKNKGKMRSIIFFCSFGRSPDDHRKFGKSGEDFGRTKFMYQANSAQLQSQYRAIWWLQACSGSVHPVIWSSNFLAIAGTVKAHGCLAFLIGRSLATRGQKRTFFSTKISYFKTLFIII